MSSYLLKYIIESEFSTEHLAEVAWTSSFFTASLHRFRWSGLSGEPLQEGELEVIKSIIVDDAAFNRDDNLGIVNAFFIVHVRKTSLGNDALFAIPVIIEVNRAGCIATMYNSDLLGMFHFQNGVDALIQIATSNPQFWKKLSPAMLNNLISNDNISIQLLDPGFRACILEWNATSESEIDMKFLGGSDTTNIVMRVNLLAKPGSDIILKFYPRLQFNTARFMNGRLFSGNYESFACMIACCDYRQEFIQELFDIIGQGNEYANIIAEVEKMEMQANVFYPFIHFFKFINGTGDGGTPFWNSAIGLFDESGSNPSPDAIHDLANKLGKTTARFHQALGTRKDDPGQVMAQRTKMVARIEDQLEMARAFIMQDDDITRLPKSFFQAREWLLQMMDVVTISEKLIPQEDQFTANLRQYIHQDLHMGQFIFMDDEQEFIVLDLEGDPQLPWRDRIDVYHVEKDIASLVRSLSYIKIAALKSTIENILHVDVGNDSIFSLLYPLLFLMEHDPIRESGIVLPTTGQAIIDRLPIMIETLNSWEATTRGMIIESYQDFRELDPNLLDFYTLQRILNEISYEIKFRPRNYFIPLIGLVELLDQHRG